MLQEPGALLLHEASKMNPRKLIEIPERRRCEREIVSIIIYVFESYQSDELYSEDLRH